MAIDFRILVHRNSDNLHLKLIGDFDGGSAHELFNLLKKNSKKAKWIIVHTSCLKTIYSFGSRTFSRNLSELKADKARILFTGEKADQLAV